MTRASEHERLLHLARHDSLTGAANRASFVESLDQTLQRGEVDIAVGYADLDGFKDVNDRLGHAAGDEILVSAAERIRSRLRAGDEFARIGGDEFTILWRGVADADVARGVAERVVCALDDEFAVEGTRVRVGISVGVALGRHGVDAATLLREADASLYDAKRTGETIALAS